MSRGVKPSEFFNLPSKTIKDVVAHHTRVMGLYVKLSAKETSLINEILYKRLELQEKINDEDTLNKVLYSGDVMDEIQERIEVSTSYFQMLVRSLKSKGVIKDGVLHPRFIPKLEDGQKSYIFALVMMLDDEGSDK